MCALETRTNFFPFKKSPKPGCVLNSGAYYIREYTVNMILFKLRMLFQQYCIPTEEVAQMVMLLTCRWKLLILNLRWDDDCSD